MTWDVPTADECPECGFSMFKKSGKGRMKPFCVNETCSRFLPEDQRGYYKKKTTVEGSEGEPAGEPAAAEKKTAAKKTAGKKASAKKSAAKKTGEKKTTGKKTTTKKSAGKKEA